MSYYPSMIIQYKFVPEHLGDSFLKVYEQIYHDRLKAKHDGNKIVAETYKLSLNGAYGNMNNKYSFLYDPKCGISICYNGQLMLLMLVEMLTEIGCDVTSANTDGITTLIPKELEQEYHNVCKQWEQLTKMNLEYVNYEKIIRIDVNNYIATYRDYNDVIKIKEKGLFITETRLGKGLSPLIIPKALQNFFLNNIPIETTIKNCKDIKQFLMFEKTGKQWTVVYNEKEQQRINRFYASTNGAYLYKWKYNEIGDKEYQNMLVASGITILNTLSETDFENYKVNYGYYISKCNELIEQIIPKQLTLF